MVIKALFRNIEKNIKILSINSVQLPVYAAHDLEARTGYET